MTSRRSMTDNNTEAVAWVIRADNGYTRLWTGDGQSAMEKAAALDQTAEPLFPASSLSSREERIKELEAESAELTERQNLTLRKWWDGSGGKAFELANVSVTDKRVDPYVNAGFVKRVDGRCGFEVIKDAMLSWTDAGKAAMTLPTKDQDQ